MMSGYVGSNGISVKCIAVSCLVGLHVLVFLYVWFQYFIVYDMCHFRETMLFMGICNFDRCKIITRAPVNLTSVHQ